MNFLKAAGILAIAVAAYVIAGPEDGMVSGQTTVLQLLHSFPIINL